MKSARNIKLLVIFLAVFVVWVVLAPFLAERLVVERKLERADAILVLGGSSTYIERTLKAAEIFKQGVAPKILLTDDGLQGGWDRLEKRNLFFAESARRELINQGVPENAIEILPSIVESTHDEAVLLDKTAKDEGFKSILIITSPYHTRRALSAFEKVFRDKNDAVELGIESPEAGFQSPKPAFWWIYRSGWRSVAGEYLKSVYYWVFY